MNYSNSAGDNRYLAWIRDPKQIPFFYNYNGVDYNGFPFEKIDETTLKEGFKETTKQVFNVDGFLNITVVFNHYYDYGATDFTVWFENVGNKDTGIIEDPRVNVYFDGEEPILKGIFGDYQYRYKPYANKLLTDFYISDKGRATHYFFPYFNLEKSDGGEMLAIGWAGRWSACFHNENGKTLYSARYGYNIKTLLRPGEKIRSALFLLAPYTVRDESYAMNYWRSWFLKYNTPKADISGKDLQPFSIVSLAGDTGLPNCDGSISENKDTWKRSMDKLFDENIKFDFRWMDAGYYPDPKGQSRMDYWGYVGNWEFDKEKWGENGFVESVDYAHKRNVKTLLWVEPERISMLDDLIEKQGYKKEWAVPHYPKELPFYDLHILNNIGNEECYEWTKNKVISLLKQNKIDVYREDYNRDPAYAWDILDKEDGKNRSGISECKAVDAHYRLWEEIVKFTGENGGCSFIDSCASGGGRNDLQSLRYGVPVLRSDADRTTTALRLSMSSSFNAWIPFNGACHLEKDAKKECEQDGIMDVYTWRASYLPIMNVLGGQFTQDKNYDFDMLRFGLCEWESIKEYLIKDFYLLTEWRKGDDRTGFVAHCYFDPEKEKGCILAFRQEECESDTLEIQLPIKNGEYKLTDRDTQSCLDVVDGKVKFIFNSKRQSKLIDIARKI